jgi:hypothetical protein
MFVKSKLADFFIRMVLGLLAGLAFAWVLSEATFLFLNDKETLQREPQQIELVIPYGTAKHVEDGLYNQALPTDMIFVEGDILVVKNEDSVAHQLGPLWVPPSTSSVLSLDQADKFSYECSFQPNKYQGLDVRKRVTGSTRFQGLLSIGLPTGMMLGLYSYLIPTRKRESDSLPPTG